MKEKFKNELLLLLDEYLDTKDLKSIAQQLDVMLSDYEIESRKTDIITYEYKIPKSVEKEKVRNPISFN